VVALLAILNSVGEPLLGELPVLSCDPLQILDAPQLELMGITGVLRVLGDQFAVLIPHALSPLVVVVVLKSKGN
jgi:hypothetical protein